MRTMLTTVSLAFTVALIASACEEPAPLPEASPAIAAKVVASAPEPAAADLPQSFVTHKTADPERMPNDSIHSSLGQKNTARPLPAGHPPLAGRQHQAAPKRPASPGMVPRGGATEQGVDRPLPLKGPGSAAELAGRVKRIPAGPKQDEIQRDLEELYRASFTIDRGKRDHARARILATKLAGTPESAAAAERVRGFLAVSTNFDTKTARAHYEKAIALESTFGEAHYALAFLCALNDREAGAKHYKSAAAAGVEDTMSLDRLYSGNPTPGKPGH
jgi:hypothetical protein